MSPSPGRAGAADVQGCQRSSWSKRTLVRVMVRDRVMIRGSSAAHRTVSTRLSASRTRPGSTTPGAWGEECVELDPVGEVVDRAHETGEAALEDDLEDVLGGEAGFLGSCEPGIREAAPAEHPLRGQRLDGRAR